MTLLTTTYDPATHKIVPIYPTPEMREAGNSRIMAILHSATPSITDRAYYTYCDMVNAAPSAPSGWISVEDALPEEEISVLVYRGLLDNGKPFIDKTCRYMGAWLVSSIFNPPTHWQYLPTPPAP